MSVWHGCGMASFGTPAGDHVPETSRSELVGVSVEWHGSTALVDVSGEVDALSAPRLEGAVTDVLNNQPAMLVIDLSRVEFLASAGLAVLAGARDSAGEYIGIRVVAQGSVTGRPLHLTGLDQDFAVYSTREDALNTDE